MAVDLRHTLPAIQAPTLVIHRTGNNFVRAAQGRATIRHRRAAACQLTEVPVEERPPILRRYLQKVPGGRPHIGVDRHAPLHDFAAVAARYPVFRVDPADAL